MAGPMRLVKYVLFVGVALVRGTVCEDPTTVCPASCYCNQGTPPDTGLMVKCISASLASIPDALPAAVERLYLDDNLIQEINPTSFSHISRTVRLISLSQNKLTDISDEVLTDNLQQLTLLDLSHNQLTTLPLYLPQTLKILKLGENLLSVLETEKLYRLGSLEELHVNHNNLQELHRDMFSHKPCQTCQAAFSKLRKLALNGNAFNQLETGAFNGLGHLLALTLAHNQITVLKSRDFEGLQELQFLDLSNNKINTIWGEAFAGLPNLKYLYIRGNFMKGLPDELPPLKWLDVSWNQIMSLDEHTDSHTLSRIEIVNLANNPLHCNRQLDWLICLMKDKIGILKQINGPISRYIPSCASPPEVAGELWDNLSADKVSCRLQSKTTTDRRFQMNDDSLKYIYPAGSQFHSQGLIYSHNDNYQVDFVHKLKIRRSESTPSSITVYWDLLDEQAQEESLIVYYYIKGHNKSTHAYDEVPSTQFQHTFHKLQPHTDYSLCLAPTRQGRSYSSYPNACIEVMTSSLPSWWQVNLVFTNVLIILASIVPVSMCFWLSILRYRILIGR